MYVERVYFIEAINKREDWLWEAEKLEMEARGDVEIRI